VRAAIEAGCAVAGVPVPKEQLDDVADDSEGTVRHIYNIRWLPPDPNDRSVLIEPEKD